MQKGQACADMPAGFVIKGSLSCAFESVKECIISLGRDTVRAEMLWHGGPFANAQLRDSGTMHESDHDGLKPLSCANAPPRCERIPKSAACRARAGGAGHISAMANVSTSPWLMIACEAPSVRSLYSLENTGYLLREPITLFIDPWVHLRVPNGARSQLWAYPLCIFICISRLLPLAPHPSGFSPFRVEASSEP